MNWSSLFISGFLVWIIQLTIADLFTIDTIRPDFIGILIVYWAVKYGRFINATGISVAMASMLDRSNKTAVEGDDPQNGAGQKMFPDAKVVFV